MRRTLQPLLVLLASMASSTTLLASDVCPPLPSWKPTDIDLATQVVPLMKEQSQKIGVPVCVDWDSLAPYEEIPLRPTVIKEIGAAGVRARHVLDHMMVWLKSYRCLGRGLAEAVAEYRGKDPRAWTRIQKIVLKSTTVDPKQAGMKPSILPGGVLVLDAQATWESGYVLTAAHLNEGWMDAAIEAAGDAAAPMATARGPWKARADFEAKGHLAAASKALKIPVTIDWPAVEAMTGETRYTKFQTRDSVVEWLASTRCLDAARNSLPEEIQRYLDSGYDEGWFAKKVRGLRITVSEDSAATFRYSLDGNVLVVEAAFPWSNEKTTTAFWMSNNGVSAILNE